MVVVEADVTVPFSAAEYDDVVAAVAAAAVAVDVLVIIIVGAVASLLHHAIRGDGSFSKKTTVEKRFDQCRCTTFACVLITQQKDLLTIKRVERDNQSGANS